MKLKFVLEIVIEAKDELQALENLVDIIKTDQYRSNKSVEDIHMVSSTRIVSEFKNDRVTSNLEDKINQVTMNSIQEEGERL